MRILEYIGLDTSGFARPYRKVANAIAAGDFRAAQVKKLAHLGQGKIHLARALTKSTVNPRDSSSSYKGIQLTPVDSMATLGVHLPGDSS